MVWPIDSTILAALGAGSYELNPELDLITATRTYSSLPLFVDSTGVSYSIGQKVGRAAAITVSRDLTDAGLFNPVTDIAILRLAIPGVTDIQLFTGRVNELSEDEQGRVVVKCTDFGDDVVNDDFIVPWTTTQQFIGDEIKRIITDVKSTFAVDTSAISPTPTPNLSWETDRGKAIEDLANGANALWQTDRGGGGFIVYPNPYSLPTEPTPVMVLKDGVNGVVTKVTKTTSRAKIYNAITLVVERSDGSAPIRKTVYDNDPTSLTRWDGPFGKRNRVIKLQTTITEDDAYRLALRVLRQSIGLTENWQVTLPFFPFIDQGDVIALWYRDIVASIVVESVDIGVAASTATRVTGRRLQLIDPDVIGLL